MKKIIPALLLLVAIGLWIFLGKPELTVVPQTGNKDSEKKFSPTTNLPAAQNRIDNSVNTGTGDPTISSTAPPRTETSQTATSAVVIATAPEPLPPLTILDNCRLLIASYRSRFGENPVGNNAEITAALAGENPKSVNFLRSDDGLRINSQGELIDAYGTPFFFHQLSAKQMEIRSAGQDRKLFTFDDQIVR